MERPSMSPPECEPLYEATRRVSSWVVLLLECAWIKDECRADLGAWLDAIPEDWWNRFPMDDANERAAADSENTHEG